MSNAAEQQYAEQGIVYLDPKMRIKNYWTQRSHSFAELRVRELNSIMADRWLREIAKYIPAGGQLRILDIGTGTGFFAFLLSSLGHRVTGIDLTPSMIQEAKEIGQTLHSSAQFRVMDAEKLLFADESFDMVISRNLTWTLPHPQEAYREWQRVLKPGGLLLNFDGNYGKSRFYRKRRKTSGKPCTQTDYRRSDAGMRGNQRSAGDQLSCAPGMGCYRIRRGRIRTDQIRFWHQQTDLYRKR